MNQSEKDELKRQIKVRKKQLENYVSFVEKIIAERGKTIEIERYEGSCHTKLKRWLGSFANFSFYSCYEETMMGGNTIKIFHHPGNADIRKNNKAFIVLHVYSECSTFEIDKFKVVKFLDKLGWQSELDQVIRNKANIIAHIEQGIATKKALQTADEEKREEIDNLLADAKRLGLE